MDEMVKKLVRRVKVYLLRVEQAFHWKTVQAKLEWVCHPS
jgi:hypothetical protein